MTCREVRAKQHLSQSASFATGNQTWSTAKIRGVSMTTKMNSGKQSQLLSAEAWSLSLGILALISVQLVWKAQLLAIGEPILLSLMDQTGAALTKTLSNQSAFTILDRNLSEARSEKLKS